MDVNRKSGLIMALALLLVGCGASTTARGNTPATSPTSAATATLVPLPHLALPWQPRPFVSGNHAIAPSDGNTIYGCAAGDNATQVWATHDGGAHVTTATVAGVNHGPRCIPVVDSGDAQTAILQITQDGHGPYLSAVQDQPQSSPGPGAPVFDIFTRDGGQSWQMIPNNVLVNEATTVQGTTYALIASPQHTTPTLATSGNGWQTWHPLTLPAAPSAPKLSAVTPLHPKASQPTGITHQLWVNPDGRHLLYVNPLTDGQTYVFSTSADGGQSWQSIQFPFTSFYITMAIQSPTIGQPWFICANDPDLANSSDAGLRCTRDGGQHWTQLPVLGVHDALLGITPGGDVVATAWTNPNAPNLWRLMPGAAQWQLLGALPDALPTYAAAPSPGVVWAQNFTASTAFPVVGWYEAVYAPK